MEVSSTLASPFPSPPPLSPPFPFASGCAVGFGKQILKKLRLRKTYFSSRAVYPPRWRVISKTNYFSAAGALRGPEVPYNFLLCRQPSFLFLEILKGVGNLRFAMFFSSMNFVSL